MSTTKKRCAWAGEEGTAMAEYHDHEWGRPMHDDRQLFEMLILEGAQAGLSWATILKRREGYRAAFKGLDPITCAKLTDPELETALKDEGIIRNRLKVYSVRKNALVFLAIQKEFGTFDRYLWAFVGGKPKRNKPAGSRDVPTRTAESDVLSKDLKKRGMSFVGTTILYAFMQATGMVDDHVKGCYLA